MTNTGLMVATLLTIGTLAGQAAPVGESQVQEAFENPQGTEAERFFRAWAPPIVLLGVSLWGFFAGGFLAYHSIRGRFILRIVETHFAAMILVPMAALIALSIVLLLRWTTGPLAFKAGSFEASGAAGPLLFWVLCFLAIVAVIRLLWPLESDRPGDVRER